MQLATVKVLDRCEYPAGYPQVCVYGEPPADVLKALKECVRKGAVPVSGVRKAVQLRSVDVRGVDVCGVGPLRLSSMRPGVAFSEYASSRSPREVLAFAMKELRQAAEAKKGLRIAKRLAALAEGKRERASSWSSRKSLRGVC